MVKNRDQHTKVFVTFKILIMPSKHDMGTVIIGFVKLFVLLMIWFIGIHHLRFNFCTLDNHVTYHFKIEAIEPS